VTIDLEFAEQVNALLIDHPASITRWVSTVAHNKAVGGAPNSGHLYGRAVDLVFDSAEEFIAGARRAFELGFQGIEADVTNRHLHVDALPRIWRVVHRGPGQESPLDAWLTGEV
jgi:hypothetical protein